MRTKTNVGHRIMTKVIRPNPIALLFATCFLLACDGAAVQLCGDYACVYYQDDFKNSSHRNCENDRACRRARSCESAGSIRDRAPRIINALREARRSCGALATVSDNNIISIEWDSILEDAAITHARDMAKNRFESFVGSDGLQTTQRVEQAGSQATPVAESIGRGPQTSAAIINYWLDIYTDCTQMLDSTYTRFALACAIEDEFSEGPYWSLVLTGPSP